MKLSIIFGKIFNKEQDKIKFYKELENKKKKKKLIEVEIQINL
jgi:hypothetical protein